MAYNGVAPFMVFFDAEDAVNNFSSEPFHDLEYRWDFGDTAFPDETWGYGARPGEILKNEATGPIAAHVYEGVGEFTATVTVWDGHTTPVATLYREITVSDPNTIFADTTVVVSIDGDFTDAPDGAIEVTSSDFDTALSDALTDGAKRILFKSGQTFNFGTTTTVSQEGPILVGSFGSGDRPILNATAGNIVAVVMRSSGIRFMDFEVDGNNITVSSPARATNLGGDNSLMLRINAHDLGYLSGVSGNNLAIVECELDNIVGGSGNMPIYAQDVFGFYVAGCRINNGGGGEYNLRYQGGTEGIITNNTLEHSGDAKAMLTIRGDYTQTTYTSGRHIVSDNYFDGASCTGVLMLNSIVPQNNERNEKIVDVIWERNYSNSSTSQFNHLIINARNITVRNNLFDSTNGVQGPVVQVTYSNNSNSLPVPSDVHFYHNTFYTNTSNGITGVTLQNQTKPVKDSIIKNNFIYAPNVLKSGEGNLGPNLFTDYGEGTVASSNTSNYSGSATEARDVATHFTVQPPSGDPDDWVILENSYATDVGEQVPVWSDFFGTPLYSSTIRSLGAILVE